MPRRRGWQPLALLVLVLALAWDSRAATTYATIEFAEGAATIVDAKGASRAARVGTAILEGETIVTGADGELHARTEDHGLVAVRPDSTLKIDAYRAKGDSQDTSVLSLVKGTLRSITGWIGKYQRDRYAIRTPNATLGIRGTDHEPLFIAPGDKPMGPPGTYDKVNSGTTFIQNQAGRVDIQANHAGFAPHEGTAPRVLERIPEFFRPTRNEGRIRARKAQLEKEMEQHRLERQSKEKAAAEKTEKAEKGEKSAGGRDKSDKEEKAEPPDKRERLEKAESLDKADKEEHKKAPRKHRPTNTK